MQNDAPQKQDLAPEHGIVTEMTQPATPPMTTPRSTPTPATNRQLRFGVLAALGLLVFLVAWILLRGSDDSPKTSAAPGPARLVAADELKTFAASVDHPVYWAGARGVNSYELTRTADGRVYVRYLPAGTQAGDSRAKFLTVGTYPRAAAFAELKRAAKAKGAVNVKLPRGGLMVFSERKPTSIYIGYPKGRYQVEVYHPSADVARRLVLSGQVRPVG